jgi:hypothetical protein
MFKTATHALVESRVYRFIFGLMLGVSAGTGCLLIFSGSFEPSWIGSAVLSAMTYTGIALILFGYFYKRGETRNFVADFFLALGIGIILVWFVGAGNGTLTLTDINY